MKALRHEFIACATQSKHNTVDDFATFNKVEEHAKNSTF